MINKAFKSIKGILKDAKDMVSEKVSNASMPSIPNPISNTFVINGKNYYENKLLGEGDTDMFSKWQIQKGINLL